MVVIGNDWDVLLKEEFEKDYYIKLRSFLAEEYKTKTIYPNMYDIFNALKYTSYENTKVVILGQDPYHGANQAHGLCFSVQDGVKKPPSLNNIFKEIQQDLNITPPTSGNLTHWTEQGVLLLNTVLTVRAGEAGSHRGKGWEIFTDKIISLLNEHETPLIFLLWGNDARSKVKLLTNSKHIILTAVHPSPLSAHSGFFGCGHFSKTNEHLINLGLSPIVWG